MSFLDDFKLAKECPLRGIFTYLLSTTLPVKAKEKKMEPKEGVSTSSRRRKPCSLS
ncbi:hypothetical protein LEP1GSC196_1133 [Leptospira meyeri serovar Semaranga str. Veldrot Semarang 173]|nr:hypothetical protein LEP1GSC196_1133 [Leptospira meyeri serovar Semaranga str. Veldrot Semarang 173]